MHIVPSDLTKLQRPKLLMSAAKCVVEKRKFKGVAKTKFDAKRVQALLEMEADFEYNRTVRRDIYRASKHIEVLAELIEHVYAATKNLAPH